MFLIVLLEGAAQSFGHVPSFFAAGVVVEKHIELLVLAATVEVNFDATLIGGLFFFGQLVDDTGALLQTFELVEGDGLALYGFGAIGCQQVPERIPWVVSCTMRWTVAWCSISLRASRSVMS